MGTWKNFFEINRKNWASALKRIRQPWPRYWSPSLY